MGIAKETVFRADDGKSYSTFEQAKIAQAKWVSVQRAQKAAQAQKDRLYQLFNQSSSNTTANSLIVMDLIGKEKYAVELRDALNKVVDYHRRKKTNK